MKTLILAGALALAVTGARAQSSGSNPNSGPYTTLGPAGAGGYVLFTYPSKTSIAAGAATQRAARGDAESTVWQTEPIKISREELHALLTGGEPAPAPPGATMDAAEVASAPAPAPTARSLRPRRRSNRLGPRWSRRSEERRVGKEC